MCTRCHQPSYVTPGYYGHGDQAGDKFAYARILTVYYAEVIYANAHGAYQIHWPQTMEFLWVCWFQIIKGTHITMPNWNSLRLDSLTFPAAATHEAFDFLNPSVVLRACHIVPRITFGRIHEDGKELSLLADDGMDWHRYYANRYDAFFLLSQ